jgi:hypothetical protein
MNTEHADLNPRFAAPAERDLPTGRHELHRQILMNHMLTQPPPGKTTRHGGSRSWRPPVRVLPAAAAAAVAAAGAAGYAITAAQTPARPPVANRSTTGQAHPGQAAQQAVLAAKVLRAAAAHISRAGLTSKPGPAQWIYYKTVSYGYPNISEPSGITTDEEWITFDGSQTAYYGNGQLVTHTSPIPVPGPTVNPWTAWNTRPSPMTAYNALAALPAAPQALLKVIASLASTAQGPLPATRGSRALQNAKNLPVGPIPGPAPTTPAQREFEYLTTLLWGAAAVGGPPAAEAAAYQAMATLPGITVQRGIQDTAGGQAIGVSDNGGYGQLLIDPVSYQVIGIRWISNGVTPGRRIPPSARKRPALKNNRVPAFPPAGTLLWEAVQTQTAEVSAPGDR